MTDVIECAPGFRPDQLAGFRIGVTSDRRSADLIDALARRGAQVVHAPTLRMTNAISDDPVIADTRAIIAARPDVLLATTAYGVRRWVESTHAGPPVRSLLYELDYGNVDRGSPSVFSILSTHVHCV